MQSWRTTLKVELDRRCRGAPDAGYPGLWLPVGGAVATLLFAPSHQVSPEVAMGMYASYLIALSIRLGSGCFQPFPLQTRGAVRALTSHLLAGCAPLLGELAIVIPCSVVATERSVGAQWGAILIALVYTYLWAAFWSLRSPSRRAAVGRTLLCCVTTGPATAVLIDMLASGTVKASFPYGRGELFLVGTASLLVSVVPTLLLAGMLRPLAGMAPTAATAGPSPRTWDLFRPVLDAMLRRPTLPGVRARFRQLLPLERMAVACGVVLLAFLVWPGEPAQTTHRISRLLSAAHRLAMEQHQIVEVSFKPDPTAAGATIISLEAPGHRILQDYETPANVTLAGIEDDATHPWVVAFLADGKARLDGQPGQSIEIRVLSPYDPQVRTITVQSSTGRVTSDD